MKKRTPFANRVVPRQAEEIARLRKTLEDLPAHLKQGGEMAVLHMERIACCHRNKPDPKLHPVLAVIFDAYILRMEQALEKWNPSPAEVRGQVRIWDDLIELQGWIHKGPEKWEKWTEADDDSAGDALVKDYGKSYSEAKRLIRKSKERRRGRPGTSRPLAVKGLELKVLRPSLLWVDIRDQICDCGQPFHGDSCLARLKSAVSGLRAVLRRYGLTIAITPQNERK
jgi:hypothetical protein